MPNPASALKRPIAKGTASAAATLTTSAVCAELIRRGIRTIVLNVAQSNASAIHVYEKLGFKRYLPFNEGVAVRKSQL